MSTLARAERHHHTEPDPPQEYTLHNEMTHVLDADQDVPISEGEAVDIIAALLWRYVDEVPPVVIHAAITVELGAEVITLDKLGDLIEDWPTDGQFETAAQRDDWAETLRSGLGHWRAKVHAERPHIIRTDTAARRV